MWFKNLTVFRLPIDFTMSASELEEKLAQRTLQPCGAFDMRSVGWVLSGPTARLVHSIGNQHLIALGVAEKLLPASIVRHETQEQAKAIAAEQGYPVGRRQLRELKERITERLRGQALTKHKQIRAWIDVDHGWLVVDAAGGSAVDLLVEALRDTLGSFAVTHLDPEHSPQMSMASWLVLGDAPLRFSIDDEVELHSLDRSKAMVRYAHQPVETTEAKSHIAAGKYATRLGLTWADRVAFVLTDKLQLKRVQFLAVIADKPEGDAPAEELFYVEFALMTGELAGLMSDLELALGTVAEAKAA